MQRRRMLKLLLLAAIGKSNVSPAISTNDSEQRSQAHVAWVAEVLQRIETVKSGMTRKALLAIFTTEGGLSTGLHRTFVSRDCPYFKVDVEFKAVGRPDRDENGRVTLKEDDSDIILSISRPYLQFSIMD